MAHSHSIKQYPGQVMAVAGIAAVAGALAAALFTPKKGSELRLTIKNRVKHLKDFQKPVAQSVAGRAKRGAEQAGRQAESTAEKIKRDAKQTGRQIRQDTKRNAKAAKDVIDHIRRNGEP